MELREKKCIFANKRPKIMRKSLFITFLAAILTVANAVAQEMSPVVVAYVTAGSNEVPDPMVMTHINYAFGNVNETFNGVNIQNPERLRMIVGLKRQNPELKVLLSIGGWTSGRFSEMAATKENRQSFARDCRRIVDEFGLDGIDMDWEYPTSSEAGISSSPDDTENFTLLMEELRQLLGDTKLLTAATICTARYIDFKNCLQYMDLVNVMSYDMSDPNKQHHAALYPSPISGYCTASQAVEAHLKAGVPKEKLVMGMPFYAKGRRSDKGVDNYLRTGELPQGYQKCWNEEAQANYIANEKGEFVWAYETVRSLTAKCQYIIDNDLRGGMYWDYVSDKTGDFRNTVCRMLLENRQQSTIMAGNQGPQKIFIYSPGEREGLHIAKFLPTPLNSEDELYDRGTWQEIGKLCASDYGTWGAEKRMYHPSITRAADGTWRLVFQVNDTAPCFAAAYSRDLITWRPQDYPIMSTKNCIEPVVFLTGDNTFDIYYKSAQGKRYVSASTDFRHFSKDEQSLIDEAAWTRDTATINGTLREGYQFEIAPKELAAIVRHFKWQENDARLSSERMHDDATNPNMPTSPIAATLTITGREKNISDKLIGIFFEDISYAADGGLYAELIQNRDFEYNEKDRREWTATTAWRSENPIRISTDKPLSPNNPHHALLTDKPIFNEGWDGIPVTAGEKYDFSMFVRGEKEFTILLLNEEGNTIAKSKIKSKGNAWQKLETVLKAKDNCQKAQLAVIPQKENEVAVDMISLFPENTFMNRKNGLRKDLAETIAALKPKFVRFPGGCMSHGDGIDNIYHWHHTVGPLEDRKPDFNIWHYHQTRGLGFFEYFQFCEDIGAEPLPVLAAGVPCQNSQSNAAGLGGQQGGIPMKDMPAYIQEFFDLIEWANGDPATSKWARMRAEAGHPAPFNLKYIGIGNEDIIGTVFEERYEMIAKAIAQKYPNIKVCGTVGPFHTPSADYIEGWDFTRKHPELQYMVDEHYYESTGWFLHHRDYYDNYNRQGTKVYLGEWAASTKTKRPNIETALAEALYLTDIERNGDIVEMTSYAPMLAKDGHHNWNPDMIYFSNTEVRPTPAYETQRLFSVYNGDRYVTSTFSDIPANLKHRIGASLVRNSKTGKRYLKLVNGLPAPLGLSLRGINIPAGAKAIGFNGQPEDQQAEVKPIEVNGDKLLLPPYAFWVIEL